MHYPQIFCDIGISIGQPNTDTTDTQIKCISKAQKPLIALIIKSYYKKYKKLINLIFVRLLLYLRCYVKIECATYTSSAQNSFNTSL